MITVPRVKLLESPDPSGLLCPGDCCARAGVGYDGRAVEEAAWGLSETGAQLWFISNRLRHLGGITSLISERKIGLYHSS